jgi:transglutaminase-like putative cysteine protease
MSCRAFFYQQNQVLLKRFTGGLLILFIVVRTLSSNAQSVIITQTPSWVEKQAPDLSAVPGEGKSGSVYYLLLDRQENVVKKTSFTHNAYKILTSEGVQEMSDISVDFDPSYQQLVFHFLSVHRDGQILKKLPSKIKTIQREQSMERYLYDGSLTAVINMEDIRVGDVVEYGYSIQGYNPVFNGRFSRKIYFDYSVPFEKYFRKILVPSSLKLQEKYYNGEVTPQKNTVGSMATYTWHLEKADAVISDSRTPSWYEAYRYAILSDFSSWPEVTAWAYQHFQVGDSEKVKLKAAVGDHIKFTSDEQFINDATRFVQDEVRYLGFESGRNSHKPHAPLKVFQQRFGDCKDKSLLLSSLLQLHGIEAYPMLVNTSARSHLSDELPSIDAFDHCVVQIVGKEKTFFIDPTISNQGGSGSDHYFPAYGKGLVVKEKSAELIDLPAPGVSETIEENKIRINNIGGSAHLTIKTEYRGGEADNQRSYFSSNSLESIQKEYINFYGNLYPDMKAEKSIETKDDREKNIFVVLEEYTIPKFWKDNDGKKGIYCELYPLSLESYFYISKSTQRKSPYHLPYPVSYDHYMDVSLPETWEIDEETDRVTSKYYTYTYDRSYGSGEKVSIHHHYQTLSDHIPAEDIYEFIRDHETMRNNMTYHLTYDSDSNDLSSTSNRVIVMFLIGAAFVIVFWRITRRS